MPQIETAISIAVASAWIVAGGREQALVFCNALALNPIHPVAVAVVVVVVTALRDPSPAHWAAAAVATLTAAAALTHADAAVPTGIAASVVHGVAIGHSTALLLFEAIGIATFITVGGSFAESSTHLTWWSMAALGVYDVVAAVSPRSTARAAANAMVILTATVAVGVLAMSIMQCNLLTNTFSDIGWAQYAFGNAAIHYYPLIRALFAADFTNGNAAVAAPVLIAAYTINRDPATIYGCNALHPAPTRALLTAVSLLLAMVFPVLATLSAQSHAKNLRPASHTHSATYSQPTQTHLDQTHLQLSALRTP